MAKQLSFSEEAKTLDASEIKDYSKAKRYTLILCLILRLKIKAKDNLVEIFIKRVTKIRNNAKQKLEEIYLENRKTKRDHLHNRWSLCNQ